MISRNTIILLLDIAKLSYNRTIIHDFRDDYLVVEWIEYWSSNCVPVFQIASTYSSYNVYIFSNKIEMKDLCGNKAYNKYYCTFQLNNWIDIENNKYSFNKEKFLKQISRLEKLNALY